MAKNGTLGRGERKRKEREKFRRGITVAFRALLLLGLLFLATFLALVAFLPLPEAPIPEASRIYDAEQRIITSLFVENRTVTPSEDIPQDLKDAVVAVEDRRFYSHHGLDPSAIGRALYRNVKAGRIVEGGSTISQQLAKNLFLTDERTLKRKLIELVYTLKLEMRYTKDEILTAYINQIYWGHGAWGAETASLTYFGKSVGDLGLAECALLAGIIRSPENYSPYADLELALRRRSTALALMAEQAKINEAQRLSALDEPITLGGLPESQAPYFVDYVVKDIASRHPDVAETIYRGGFQIYTTLDLDIQKAAEDAFAAAMPEGQKDVRGITQPQGALIAIQPETGYIVALVGGRDWANTQLNRAFQVKRQPGSAFKIFLYSALIDARHYVTETKVCEPVEYPGARPGEKYVPVDYGRHPYHYAPLDMRTAIAISDNVVAAKWASDIGPSKIAQCARRMGIGSDLEESIPLALGASEVTPLEMTVAAATLASGGIRPDPIAVLKVIGPDGRVIEENKVKRTPALDPGVAYIVTSLLRSVFASEGTAAGLDPFWGRRPVAGKTGTTDGLLEGWFVGYTKELAASVYVGWDNREKALSATGAATAGPVWAQFMGAALAGTPVTSWDAPSNVVWREVCDETGLLAGRFCTETHYEVFLKDALPPVHTIHLPSFTNPWTGSSLPEGEEEGRDPLPVVFPVEAMPLDPVEAVPLDPTRVPPLDPTEAPPLDDIEGSPQGPVEALPIDPDEAVPPDAGQAPPLDVPADR